MSELTEIRNKDYSALSKTEKALVVLWEEPIGYETIAEEAAAELAAMREVIEAARVIFNVSNIYTHKEPCPHGNFPSYPTHAWWCDDCFGALHDALRKLDDLENV